MNTIPPKKVANSNSSTEAGSQSDKETQIAAAVAEVRSCVLELEEAMREEGIDPRAPLGIWCRALQNSIGALATFVDVSTDRVEGKSEVVERAMTAQVERVKVAIEESRAETIRARISTAHSEELRKVENLKLARELGEGIKETLRSTMLAREIRFNRRQNWSAVALVAFVLFGCFIGGGVWAGYRSDHGVVGRCLAKQVADEAGQHFYCSMDVVRGGS